METTSSDERPETVITCNDFSYQNVTPWLQQVRNGFTPFVPMEGDVPVLHLGFCSPQQTVPSPGFPLNIYFRCEDGRADRGYQAQTRSNSGLIWEYWNGTRWSALSIVDRTNSLSRSGVLRITVPPDWQPSIDFNQSLCWIRIRAYDEGLSSQVQCKGILPHTVMALHATTLRDETLGNSNGTAHQSFRLLRTPELPGQRLVVDESHPRRDSDKLWVEWKAVDHFLHSGPHDRHYTIDRQTGEIVFGDGKR